MADNDENAPVKPVDNDDNANDIVATDENKDNDEKAANDEAPPPSELPVLKVERPAPRQSDDNTGDDGTPGTVTFAPSTNDDEKKGKRHRRRSSRLSRSMTSYKFVNLSKTALVVIDIGEVYTKCGFAGESQPRHIFYNAFKYSDGRPMGNVFSRGHHNITRQEWDHAVWEYVNRMYFFLLQISPRERKVLVCENPFIPYRFRRAFVRTLLQQGAPGIVFVNNNHLATLACQVQTGVLVDCGFGETRIMPVVHGFALPHIREIVPLGMCDAHVYFQEIWKAELPTPEAKRTVDTIPFAAIDDMLARTMWVKPEVGPRESVCANVTYSMGSSLKLQIPGIARQTCMDALFGENSERINIVHGVLSMLMRMMPETRADVIDNIMLCGGTAMVPGFTKRFILELNRALEEPRYADLRKYENKFRFCELTFRANILSWVGGSLLGSLTLKEEHFITTERLKDDENKHVVVTRVHPHTKIYSKLLVDDPMDYGVLDWTLQLPELESDEEVDDDDDGDYDDLDAKNDEQVTF